MGQQRLAKVFLKFERTNFLGPRRGKVANSWAKFCNDSRRWEVCTGRDIGWKGLVLKRGGASFIRNAFPVARTIRILIVSCPPPLPEDLIESCYNALYNRLSLGLNKYFGINLLLRTKEQSVYRDAFHGRFRSSTNRLINNLIFPLRWIILDVELRGRRMIYANKKPAPPSFLSILEEQLRRPYNNRSKNVLRSSCSISRFINPLDIYLWEYIYIAGIFGWKSIAKTGVENWIYVCESLILAFDAVTTPKLKNHSLLGGIRVGTRVS